MLGLLLLKICTISATSGWWSFAYSLPENDYDAHSLGEVLSESGHYGSGLSGKNPSGRYKLITPGVSKKSDSPNQKRKARTRFRRRVAIEPRIGHTSRTTSASLATSSRGERAMLSLSSGPHIGYCISSPVYLSTIQSSIAESPTGFLRADQICLFYLINRVEKHFLDWMRFSAENIYPIFWNGVLILSNITIIFSP